MRYRLHFRLSLTSAVSPTHELIFTHGSMSKCRPPSRTKKSSSFPESPR